MVKRKTTCANNAVNAANTLINRVHSSKNERILPVLEKKVPNIPHATPFKPESFFIA
jgi:hypothetical protein